MRLARIWIAIVSIALGSLLVAPASAQSKKEATKKEAPAAEKSKELIDLNSATVEELHSLPGIGEAYAKRIVDARPFARKDELVTKKIIPQATYDKIKDAVIARQGTAKKSSVKKK